MNMYNNNTVICGNSYSNITIDMPTQNSVWNYFNFTFIHDIYNDITSIFYNNNTIFNSNNIYINGT